MKRRTLLASVATLLTGCVGGGSAEVDEDASPRERLRQRAVVALEGTSIATSPTVDVAERDGAYYVAVGYVVETSLGADGTQNLTDDTAYQTIEAVFEDSAPVGGVSVTGFATLTNEYGEESQEELTYAEVSDETAERIVWENTNYTDLSDFADEYRFHSRYF